MTYCIQYLKIFNLTTFEYVQIVPALCLCNLFHVAAFIIADFSDALFYPVKRRTTMPVVQ